MNTRQYKLAIRGRRLTDQEYLDNATENEINPGDIIKQVGSWAITKYGLESLSFHYCISADRLWENSGNGNAWTWERHMSDKRWVIQRDFLKALEAARQVHAEMHPSRVEARRLEAVAARDARKAARASDRAAMKAARMPKVRVPKAKPPKPERESFKTITPKVRFLVLKRDNYRCQICGATAQDGAKLHVDHKVPRSKGGPNTMSNLWALCWECNIGKMADEL